MDLLDGLPLSDAEIPTQAARRSRDVLDRYRALSASGNQGKRGVRSALLLAFLLLMGCDDAPGEWSAIVYPDRNDRTHFDVTSRFKTLSYCREAAIERTKAIQVGAGGDYACGYQCELSGDSHRMNVCKETRK